MNVTKRLQFNQFLNDEVEEKYNIPLKKKIIEEFHDLISLLLF